jgi:hypothetical protein
MQLSDLLNFVTAGWNQIGNYVLNIFYLIIVLILGGFVARVLQIIVVYLLKWIGLETLAKKIEFSEALKRAGIRKSLNELMGDLVYWLVIVLVVIAVVNLSGYAGAALLNKTINFFFVHVGTAILVVIFSIVISSFAAQLVSIVISSLGVSNPTLWGKLTRYTIIFIGFIIALVELGITSPQFAPAFSVVVGGVCLALAIAFGLGCKDLVADFFNGLIRNNK